MVPDMVYNTCEFPAHSRKVPSTRLTKISPHRAHGLGSHSRMLFPSFELAPRPALKSHLPGWHQICTYLLCGPLGRTPQSPRPLTPCETLHLTAPPPVPRANFSFFLPPPTTAATCRY